MNIQYFLYQYFKRLLQQKTVLLIMILLPVILTFILGTTINNINHGTSEMKMEPIAYSIGDTDEDIFMEIEKESGFDFVKMDRENAIEALKKNELTGYLDFQNGTITQYYHDEQSLDTQVVRLITNIIQDISRNYSLSYIYTDAPPERLEKGVGDFVEEMPYETGFNFMTYYAITMMTLITTFLIQQSMETFAEEYDIHTMQRMMQTPIRPVGMFAGMSVSMIAIGLVQIGIVIFLNRMLYQINYVNPVVVGIFMLSMIVLQVAIGFAIATTIKNRMIGSTVTMLFINSMVFLGGGYIPTANFGIPKEWTQLSYVRRANDALLEYLKTEDLQQMVRVGAGMLLLSILFYGIAYIGFLRKGESSS